MYSILAVTFDQLQQIAIYVVILLAAWFVLRLILRITTRIFMFGCGAIIFLGLALVFMQWMAGS
jgi:hypothetical protein